MRRDARSLFTAVALGASAVCLVAIALMVGVQLAARLIDGTLRSCIYRAPISSILSLNEIGGYLLAAASFLALGGTLKAGAHIRVTLVLAALSERGRRYVELWAFGFAAATAGYMTGHLINFAWVSFRFHEVSPGVIRVPLVYPQAAMALGALILTVALMDELFIVATPRSSEFPRRGRRHHMGKEG